MSYISSVRLANFKCFPLESVPVRRLTVLTGLNGSGKSTVLQALLVLQQSGMFAGRGPSISNALESMLPAHLFDQFGPQLAELSGGGVSRSSLSLTGPLVHLGTGKDVLFEHADSDDASISVTWDNGQYLSVKAGLRSEQRTVPVTSVSTPNGHPSFSVRYVSSSRLQPAAFYPLAGTDHSDETESDWSHALDYLSRHSRDRVPVKALHHSSGQDVLHSQVEAWLNEICPGVRFQAQTLRHVDVAQLLYTFTGELGESNPRRPTNVGFGLTYILPILVAVLSARPGAIVLIENPEVFIHPRGQSMIGRFLACAAQGGVQVLVETHSDHVLNGIRVAAKKEEIDAGEVEVLYFERREGAPARHLVHRCRLAQNGRFGHTPDGFFDQFESDLAELL